MALGHLEPLPQMRMYALRRRPACQSEALARRWSVAGDMVLVALFLTASRTHVAQAPQELSVGAVRGGL